MIRRLRIRIVQSLQERLKARRLSTAPARVWRPLGFVAGAHIDSKSDVPNETLLQHSTERLNVKHTEEGQE
jgi:hypothetical protein